MSVEHLSRITFPFNGVELVADLSGALYLPARGILVVADLHLEKGSAFAKSGQMLPPYDSGETLRRLKTVIDRYQPQSVACLGDSFHDDEGVERLSSVDRESLNHLAKGRQWIWVSGNHDPFATEHLAGQTVADWAEGGLVFRHEAKPGAVAEISGHYHPKATVTVRTGQITGRCFVTDGRKVILPAFGAFAGGLSIHDPAISKLLTRQVTFFFLGEQRIFAFPFSTGQKSVPQRGARHWNKSG